MAEPTSNKQYIASILDSKEKLVKSEMKRLANINEDELDYMEKKWGSADLKRRREIITCLFDLSEHDYYLDFTGIYRFSLSDKDAKVRADSINALADEEDTTLINTFINLMKDDKSVKVRIASTEALGKLSMQGELGKISQQDTDLIYKALLDILDNKTEDASIRASALEAIAPLEMPRVKGLIEEAYHSKEPILKISAIRAMGLNCNRMWLTALIEKLESDDEIDRYEAAKACGELGEEDAVLYLIDLIEDESPRVSEAAIKAMGEIGGEEAKEMLIRLSSNPRKNIRHTAKLALQELELCEDPQSTNF